MKGDFSRLAHDRRKHYSRVLKQQGRVDLDADHNEGAEIHHHLDRVTRRDVIGLSGVPRENGAFKLEPTSDNQDLVISEGRFYVDGLVVEVDSTWLPVQMVQGDAQSVRVPQWDVDGQPFDTDQWVELAAENVPPGRMRVTGIDASARKVTLAGNLAPYAAASPGARLRRLHTLRTQADAPDAASTTLQSGSPLLLYLEVFERHVTEIEDPALREVALGGPDTTTRVKTVWRLLTLPAGNAEDCASPVAGWPPAPGKGRLTTTATATPKSDDPCVLPPEGGYRGIENRLYRVEIHKAGNVGAAAYKWSRDNGALAYAVEGFLPAEGGSQVKKLRLQSMGRDRTLGLREGDWVEVTDDEDELAGRSGTLALVEKVDLAERTVRIDKDVAAYQDRNRKPKLRRWDMKGPAVTANGIVIDGSTDELEDGVTVDFSGTDLRAGDWWSFAARVATGDVERLHARPPMNEPRRHARIALLTWELDPVTSQTRIHLQDCRKPFDPLTEPCGCCCDVTVGDGVESFGDYTDLQKAIDSIHARGRVCILKGTHKVKRTIAVSGAQSLHVRACGGDARIQGPANQPTFSFANSANVLLENLHVRADANVPLIRVTDSGDVTLRHCHLLNASGTGAGATSRGPAASVASATNVVVEECALSGLPALVLGARGARVTRNRVKGGGIAILERSDDVLVEENEVASGKGHGVTLGWAPPDHKPEGQQVMTNVTLRGNLVRDMEGNGIATRDPLAQDDRPPLVADLVVEGNTVRGCVTNPPPPTNKPNEAHGGMVLRFLEGATLHANQVVGNAHKKARAVGILAHGRDVTITDNRVEANGMEPAQGSAGEGRQISFETMDPDERDGNSREVDGVKFEVFDSSGRPVQETQIKDFGDRGRGLDCVTRTLITLPEPANGVELKIGAFFSGGKVVATSADGATRAENFDINDDEPVHVSFDLPEVETVEIRSEKNVFLMVLETGDADLPPQPFQGGIFVLGPAAIHREKPKSKAEAKREMEERRAREEGDFNRGNDATAFEDATPQDKKGKNPVEFPKDFGPEGRPGWDRAEDLVVHDNVVNAPGGLALAVVARGPVSVQDNRLRSHGLAPHGERLLDRAGCVVVNSGNERLYAPLPQYQAAMMYARSVESSPYNKEASTMGSPGSTQPGSNEYAYEYAPPPSSDATAPAPPREEVPEQQTGQLDTPDRRVLVQGNQVALVAPNAPAAVPAAFLASPTDDLVVAENQFRTDLGGKHLKWAVEAEGLTAQVRGNRFHETPLAADFSLRARGSWGYVLLNVAMHCIHADQALRAEENVVQTRSDAECKETMGKYG